MNQDFLDAYMLGLLWSSHDVNEEGEEFFFDECEADASVAERAGKDCDKFLRAAGPLIQDPLMRQAGHDFALTRNGHGTGFWDRPEVYGQDAADRLTNLAHKAGEVELYLGDDGRVYC